MGAGGKEECVCGVLTQLKWGHAGFNDTQADIFRPG